jgi:hypothetical protein
MSKLFQIPELTPTELVEVEAKILDPLVQRYLRMLGLRLASQVYQMYSDGSNDPKFLRDIASVQGQISAIEALIQNSGK